MRDLKRIKKLLKLIQMLWEETGDDQRFYQLLTNIGIYEPNNDLYYLEDDEIIKVLQQNLNEFRGRLNTAQFKKISKKVN